MILGPPRRSGSGANLPKAGKLERDVRVPVVWWHGDADHIVRMAHGVHMVSRLPDAELRTLPGESHLAGLGVAEEIVTTLIGVWDERAGAVPA